MRACMQAQTHAALCHFNAHGEQTSPQRGPDDPLRVNRHLGLFQPELGKKGAIGKIWLTHITPEVALEWQLLPH